ncbi:30S ribosomal protein S5, partial [Candidatus Margulisiibacteriota bacterium]
SHEITGKFGASKVMLRPAPVGTGVIAGGAMRIILELAGIKDVVAKSLGSSNAINAARATLDGLTNLRTVSEEQELRGKNLDIKLVQSE